MADSVVLESVADLQKLIRGSSNSQSMALLNSVMAETIGMTMYNAVSTQHNAQMLNSAATTSTCAKILSVIGVKTDLLPAPSAGTDTTVPDNSGEPSATENNDQGSAMNAVTATEPEDQKETASATTGNDTEDSSH